MKMKKYVLHERISIVFYLVILILMQMPWFVVGGHRYNIYQAYGYVQRTGFSGLSEEARMTIEYTASGNAGTLDGLMKVQMISVILFQILCVGYIISVLLRKNWHLNVAALFAAFAMQKMNETGMIMVSENRLAGLFGILFFVACMIEFGLSRVIEEWDEASKQEKYIAAR